MSDSGQLNECASLLPVYEPIRNGKICLTDDEIHEAGQSVHRKMLALVAVGSLATLAALVLCAIAQSSCAFFWAVAQCLKAYIFAGLLLPSLMGQRAFFFVNDNQRARATSACQLGWTFGKWLMPIGPYLSIIGFGQPMAICRSMEGRHVDAQLMLAQLTGVCSNSQALRTSLGNIYARMGRFDLAEPIFVARLEQAKKWDGTPMERAIAYNNVGWLYFLTGRYSEAKEVLEEALRQARGTNRRPLVHIKSKVTLCRTLIRLGQIEEAEVLLEEAWNAVEGRSKSIYSSKTEAQTAFAELRLAQGRLDEALLHARTAQECADVTSTPGSIIADYASRLHAQILKAMGRLPESDKILFEAEFHKAALLEANIARIEQLRLNRIQSFRQICFDNQN